VRGDDAGPQGDFNRTQQVGEVLLQCQGVLFFLNGEQVAKVHLGDGVIDAVDRLANGHGVI
jgi:hypothetical protein